jgi:hypothetical protein
MPEHATVTRPRPRTAPIGPRRVSGPSRRPIPAGRAIPQRGRTGAFEKLSRLPDHRVVDRLLRGRACILVIGLMLGGIVAMQVSLLRLNSGISRAVQTQSTLAAQNMALEKQIAQARSGDGVGAAAAAIGMVDPPAGERRFVTARPATDPRRAARRMEPPSQRAIEIMANGGMLPGALAAPGTTAAALAAQPNGQPVPTPVPGAVPTTTTPPATTSTAPAPTATPVVPAPTATVAPPVSTAPDPGAATAPQG